MKILAALAGLLLIGCTTVTTTDPTTGVKTTKVDVTQSKIAVATHADLQAAAKRADANGYPERAALWRAEDAKLTAVEQHVSACANSIRADLTLSQGETLSAVGPFDAAEALAEKIGNFTGPSAKTKVLCAPMPVVLMPILPKP